MEWTTADKTQTRKPVFDSAHPTDQAPRLNPVDQAIAHGLSDSKYRQLHESMMDAFVSVGLDGRPLEFETLLANLSARFIDLPTDQVDSEIQAIQRCICEYFHLDRSVVWQFLDSRLGTMRITHIYHRPLNNPITESMDKTLSQDDWNILIPEVNSGLIYVEADKHFPWTTSQWRNNQTVIISRLDDLPEDACLDKEFLRHFGVQSNVMIPLVEGGLIVGAITFVTLFEERAWPETVVRRLQAVARIIAHALGRQRMDQKLRDSEARMMLAAESANVGMWDMDIGGNDLWATGKALELFGLGPDDQLTREKFLSRVHPEDVDQVLQALQQSAQLRKQVITDFRIMLPDGQVRWLTSRGQSMAKLTGEPVRVMGVAMDITDRIQFADSLAERLKFEELLADLSAQFINLPTDQVDCEIENAQRRVCECLGLDLSGLWWEVEPNKILLTHLYRKTVDPPTPARMDAQDYFPWVLQQERAGKTVIISSEADIPPEAARDREVWRQFGIKSTLSIPLSAGGGGMLGALSFDTLQAEHPWPEALVKRLQLVASIFANALVRKRADENLCEHKERLTLATEGAEVGLWSMEFDTRRVWVTHLTREMFHFAPDKDLTEDDFLGVIHPEDRDRVHHCVRESLQFGRMLLLEFRIGIPGGNGEIRWIMAHGKPILKPSGEPYRLLGLSIDITERKRMEEQIQLSHQKIVDLNTQLRLLNTQLERENIFLKEEFKSLNGHSEIVGQSQAIKKVFQQIEQVAPTDSNVLITGETGTGKELVARAIHAAGKRKEHIMVKVNCATLPSSLIEGELFGREKGAYTGALTRQIGRFELADKGTIFLDEIGELSLDLQVKLLRVLQEGEFERLGGPRTIRVNVRVIAATNRNLVDAVRKGDFRKDLYYRLRVFPIEVPPLRARTEDIPLLVWTFIDYFGQRMGRKIKSIPQKTMEQLKRYSWPGNVRELRNTIEHAMILSRGEQLDVQIPQDAEGLDAPVILFHDAEQRHILAALQKTDWQIKGPQGAAALLGLKPSTLYTKMQRLGISPRRLRDVKPS